MKRSFFTLFLLTLLIFATSLSNTIPKINFIYKDKIVPFKENPLITGKEIYFSVEDFGILMKFVGFIDYSLSIENQECTVISNYLPKFKKIFTSLIHKDKIYIRFSSVNNEIGL